MTEQSNSKISEEIRRVLKEKVDPLLAEHHGGANLSCFEDGVAMVRLTGACASCPSAQFTIEDVVKEVLLEELPEVKDVILDNSVSEDLLDMAKQILNKK